MNELLPIAAGDELRAQAKRLGRRNRRALLGMVGLHAAAATAGLAGPPVLGALVQSVQQGTTTKHVDEIVGLLAIFLVVETILTWFARRASFVLSEKIFAELREDFMRRVLALPLSTVERAGTGDLVSRTTADIDSLARTVRFAVPETLIAGITTLLTVVAAIWVNALAALPALAGVPLLFFSTRWYLKRAPAGYLWERASYATLAGTVSEWNSGIESTGSIFRSRWWRQATFGVSAESRLTSPTAKATAPASAGSPSARRIARRGAARRWSPRRQAEVSRLDGAMSRQSLSTR